MDENIFKAQYDITKKSRFKKFYESNKILIFSIISVLIIFIASFIFYTESKEKKKIFLADSYIDAKIYLQNKEKNKAKDILKSIINSNDSTYSLLSLFLILDENLISDQEELSRLFDQILKSNEFEKEIKNLIIFKKLLFKSNFASEQELLDSIKPLLSSDTLWKSHA